MKVEGISPASTVHAPVAMVARHFNELVCWQLADQLRRDAFVFTGRPRWQGDRKLREQTEDALGSVCRNIAEGFGCESHDEFARFLEISRRSLL